MVKTTCSMSLKMKSTKINITNEDIFESVSKFVPVVNQKMMVKGSIFLVGWEDIAPFWKDFMMHYDESQRTTLERATLDCIVFSCITILRLLHLIQTKSTVMVNPKLFKLIIKNEINKD